MVRSVAQREDSRYGREMLRAERALLESILSEARGNVAEAARLAEIPVRTFWRRLDLAGLNPRRARALGRQVPDSAR